MNNLEYIDDYFNEQLQPGDAKVFEQKITNDREFADEVAFYLSVRRVLHSELSVGKKEQFRMRYTQTNSGVAEKAPVRSFLSYVAAAAVIIAIFIGVWFWMKPTSPETMANRYIQDNLGSFSVTMSNESNNLQSAKLLYNQGKLEESLSEFEKIASRDTSMFEAKKHAGIVALRLLQYDKALLYFSQLVSYTSLYSNPALFYHALTLMKRNQQGDREKAKVLLQTVVNENYEGADIAQKWLDKL